MKRQMEGEHLSKEEYANQPFGNSGPDQPAIMASEQTLKGRTIRPLRKPKWAKGAGGGSGSGGGSSLPNVFAGAAQGVTFGGNANGSAQPAAPTGFGGFGGSAPSSGTSTPNPQPGFGGNGFGFGQNQQQDQGNSNPFASPAPTPAPQGNGTGSAPFQFNTSAPASNGLFGGNSNGTGNTAASAPAPFGNSFGATTQAPASTGFQFGGSNTTPSSNLFGNSNNAHPPSSSTGFNFGSTASTDSNPSFAFGQNVASKPEAPAASAPGFSFGTPAAAPPPSVGTGFTFGTTAAAAPQEKKDEAPKPFAGFGNAFGSNSDKPKDEAPKPNFGFGAPSASTNNSLFGKAPEQPAQGSSLFGNKPTPSPEPPASNLFGSKPAEQPAPQGNSLFGAPKAEEPKSTFTGFGASAEKKDEPVQQSLFGGGATSQIKPASTFFGTPAVAKKDTPLFGGGATSDIKPASTFFGAPANENKSEPAKPIPTFGTTNDSGKAPLFGSAPTSEKKEDPPKSSFFNSPGPSRTPSAPFGQAPAASSSLFGKPAEAKAPAPSFTPAASNAVSYPALPAPKSASSSIMRGASPPLPPGASSWPTGQLNEFYNLFALRSLNHAFKDQLSQIDIFTDFSELCQMYQEEAGRIRSHIEGGTRYRFDEVAGGQLGPGAPGKRAGEDSNEGGGKRRNIGEDSKSSSSQALASIIGSGASGSNGLPQLAQKPAFGFTAPTASTKINSDGPKLASKPAFGFVPPKPMETKPTGSIFNQPASNTKSSWDNPFKSTDTSMLPDDPIIEVEEDGEDSGSSTDAPKRSDGLFGRISSPPKATSLFGSPSGDNTWSPDKGLKFGNANSTQPSGSLFGSGTASSSPFNTSADVGFSFGNSVTKPSSSLAPPAANSSATTPATTASDVSESEKDGEPSDAPPPPKPESALSQKGPGEEDEDSLFECRAILYNVNDRSVPPVKSGVGQLRVLKNHKTGKARLLMRTDGGKVVLNASVMPKIKYDLSEKKALSFPEFLEGGGVTRWSVKVKKEESAQEMVRAVNTAKGA